MSINTPGTSIEQYIVELAARHNVVYLKTAGDALADDITRLAGDEVEFDNVVCLLIALERAGVVASKDVTRLHHSYLQEKFQTE